MNNTRARSIAHAEMERHLASAVWTLPQKLALACRILAADGQESNLAGQVTARGNKDGQYLMLEYGLGLEDIAASNVHVVDEDLRVLGGSAMVNPANRFHLWIYRARPDIMAIVHTHAPYASALSMIGQPLVAAHMDTMALYDDCAHLATWPGVPVGDEEGEIIAAALGNKRAALLAHHGLLATGRTIEEAAIIACTIERAARLQLLAGAAGKIQEVDPALARQAHDYRSYPKMLEASFSALARRIAKAQPEVLN
jgi:L-fuculose-phosphate aldolase